MYIYWISAFIETLMEELAFERVPSGGAGNKMMMLLEGGAVYLYIYVSLYILIDR